MLNSTGQIDQLTPVTIFNENWSATTPQDRVYPLADMAELTEQGNYYVRITSYLPGGIVENADSFNTVFVNVDNMGMTTTLLPGTIPMKTGTSITVRGGVYGLD